MKQDNIFSTFLKLFFVVSFCFFNELAFAQNIVIQNLVRHIDSSNNKVSGRIISPVLCPLDDSLVAFVVYKGSDENILFIYNIENKKLFKINSITEKEDEDTPIRLKSSNDQLNWRPVKSVDGNKWFVFLGSGSTSNWDIYLGYPGIEKPIRLTTDTTIDYSPKWSPDGEKIAFVSTRTGKGDIYLLENIDKVISTKNPDAANLRRITFNPEQDRDPAWHPGGSILVFSSFAEEEGTEVANFGIAMYDFKNKRYHNKYGPKRITVARPDQQETNPAFSPDGTKLAYYIDEKISEIKLDSKEKVNIEWGTFGPPNNPVFTVISSSTQYFVSDVVPEKCGPVWSPNSDSIVFIKHDSRLNYPIVAANNSLWVEGRETDYMSIIDTKTVQNSHLMMLYRRKNFPLAAFVAMDGSRYVLYTVELGGNIFPVSPRDFVSAKWKKRPTIKPWWLQWKFVVPTTTVTGVVISFLIGGFGGEDNLPLPPIGDLPPLPGLE